MSKAKVVAISGVSGCGKTSIVKQLSKDHACPYLLFDDFSDDNTYPKDMKQWLNHGCDSSEIKTPKFVSALRQLKIESTHEYIFIEEPFGRCRHSLASLIDYVILLDMPMEVCLSRVIMRNINHPNSNSLSSIPRYLSMYDDYLRAVYIESTNQVRQSCDLIVEEVKSIESTAKPISHWLNDVSKVSK